MAFLQPASTNSQHQDIINKPYFMNDGCDSGKLPLFDIIVTPPHNDDESSHDDGSDSVKSNRTRKPALISSPAIDIVTEEENLSSYGNCYLVVPSDVDDSENSDMAVEGRRYRSRSYSFSAGGTDEAYDHNWNSIRDRVREKFNLSSKSTQDLDKASTIPLRRSRSKSVIGNINNNSTLALPYNVRKRLSFSEIAGERGEKLRFARSNHHRYFKGMEQSGYDLVVPIIDPVRKAKFKVRSNSAIVMTAYDKKLINIAQERARGMKKSVTSQNNNGHKNDINLPETAPINSASTRRTFETEVTTPRSKINGHDSSNNNNYNQLNDMEIKSAAAAKAELINGQSLINDDSTVERPHTPTSAFFSQRLRGRTYTSPHDIVNVQEIIDANMETSINKDNKDNCSSNQDDVTKVKTCPNPNDSSNGLTNGNHEKINQDLNSPRSLLSQQNHSNRRPSIDENSSFEINGDPSNGQNGMVLSSSNESCVSESFHHQVRQQLQEITSNLTSSVLVQYVPNPHDM